MNVAPMPVPVTTPVLPTVATDEVLLLQAPPGTELVSEVVAPKHTDSVPLIEPGLGAGATVIAIVSRAVPQLLLNV